VSRATIAGAVASIHFAIECFELAKRFGLASTYDNLIYLDFVDARAVLHQALQMDDWEEFLVSIDGIPGYDEHADVVPVGLVVDNTGKLAKLLLEYLRRKEHDSDHAAKSGDKRT